MTSMWSTSARTWRWISEIRLEWARIPAFLYALLRVPVRHRHLGRGGAVGADPDPGRGGREGLHEIPDRGRFSADPIDLLKMAGVDMSKKEPVEAATKL